MEEIADIEKEILVEVEIISCFVQKLALNVFIVMKRVVEKKILLRQTKRYKKS